MFFFAGLFSLNELKLIAGFVVGAFSLIRRLLRIVPTSTRSMTFLKIKLILELGVSMAQERMRLNRSLSLTPNLFFWGGGLKTIYI